MDSNFNSQNGYDQASGQPAYGQPQYQQNTDGQAYGQPQYQQNAGGQTYGQPQYQQNMGGQIYGQPQYQQNTDGQTYGQPQYQQNVSGQIYGQPQYQQGMGYAQGGYMQPGSKIKVKRTFNLGHFMVMGGSLLSGLSVFMPYVSGSFLGFSESTSLFSAGEDGVIFLVIGIVTAILGLLRLNILNIATTGFLLFLAIYEINAVSDYVNSSYGIVDPKAGYYCLIIGAIIAFVGSVIGLALRIKQKHDAQIR